MDLYRHQSRWLTPKETGPRAAGVRHGQADGEWLAELPDNRAVVHQAV